MDLDKNNENNSNEARHSETDNDGYSDEDNTNDSVNYETIYNHANNDNEHDIVRGRGVSRKRVLTDSTREVPTKKRKKSPKYGTCDVSGKDNQDDDTCKATGKVDRAKTFPRTVDDCFDLINGSLLLQTVLNNMIKTRVILPNILYNLMSEQLFNVTKGTFENHKIPSAQDVATHVYQKIIVPYAVVKKDGGDFSIQITIGDFRKGRKQLTRKTFVKKMMKYTCQTFLTKLVEFSNARERKLQADEERAINSSLSGSESSFLYHPLDKKLEREKMMGKKLAKKQDREDQKWDKKLDKDKDNLEDFLLGLSQNTVAVGGREAKDVSNLYNYKNKNDAYVQEVAERLKAIMKNPNSI